MELGRELKRHKIKPRSSRGDPGYEKLTPRNKKKKKKPGEQNAASLDLRKISQKSRLGRGAENKTEEGAVAAIKRQDLEESSALP